MAIRFPKALALAACAVFTQVNPAFGQTAAEGKVTEGAAVEYLVTSPGSPYREHASLALFSLGSLAMGGVIYGIHYSLEYPQGKGASGDGTKVGMAIGAAGLTALAAGASYLYYSWRGRQPSEARMETLSAGLSPDGALSATLTVPLASLAPD